MAQITSKTLVQMKLGEKDLERIDNIKNLTGETNRTRIVTTAIELADMVISNLKKKGKVVIEHPDGSKETIKLVGL